MRSINIHDAKTHLSSILADVMKGEEVVIAKAGCPIAKLVPFRKVVKRELGLDAGKITIAEDFNELPGDVIAAFEGSE